jgi:hypothetical protein
MNTRCKPGDLAYVVYGAQSGAIVSVIKASTPLADGSPTWSAESRAPLKTVNPETGQRRTDRKFRVPDFWLRPISGVPVDDKVTENLKERA